MPIIYQYLTDRTLVTTSAITTDTLIHVVNTNDLSQNPAGSSYKAKLSQILPALSGLTFTGGSSNCISDLYVSNIHSCSPLIINKLDEGNVYFGSTSGITIDVINKRIGINTNNPQYNLDIKGGQSNLYFDPTSVGGKLVVSGTTNLPRFNVEVPPYLTKLQATVSIGMRAWNDTLYPDYGNLGDAHIYAGVNAYGLNIISEYGANSADYIRFYAGQDAFSGNTPDIHIQGSGSTRGYVGIGISSPTEKLEVSGKTKTINLQITSGATNGYILKSDSLGNAQWSPNILTTTSVSASTYTANTSYTYYGVTYSGNTDIQIPSATSLEGFTFNIKDERGTAGTYRIRVTPTSGLIDGNTYIDMNINYMSLTFVARNNNWWII